MDENGNPQGAWSGSPYVDSKGNLTLTHDQGTDPGDDHDLDDTADLLLPALAAQTMLLGPASAGPPQGPYSGSEFSTPTFPIAGTKTLQWTDQNSDGLNYLYVLLVWQVNSTYPNGRQCKIDPRIINRGTSK